MSSSSLKVRHYSDLEKKIFLEILKKYSNIVENKKSDGAMLKQKENAWKNIAREYNDCREVCNNRTVIQLKKLWSNMKHTQREALTKEKQKRMGTGGGSGPSSPDIDPDVAEIAPHLMVTAPTLFSSNMSDSEILEASQTVVQDLRKLATTNEAENDVILQPLQPTSQTLEDLEELEAENDVILQPSQPNKRKHYEESSYTNKKMKKIKVLAEEEDRLLKFRFEKEQEIYSLRLEQEKQLFEIKKQHLLDIQCIQMKEAEAKQKLAEKMLENFIEKTRM